MLLSVESVASTFKQLAKNFLVLLKIVWLREKGHADNIPVIWIQEHAEHTDSKGSNGLLPLYQAHRFVHCYLENQ